MSGPPEHPGSPTDPPGYAPVPPGYPQPGGYPPPRQGFDVGDAFNWAWNKFSQNAGPLIISTLLYVLLLMVLGGVLVALIFATADTDTVTVSGDGYYDTSVTGTLTATSIVVMIVGYIVIFALSMFIQAAFLTGCLDIADGKPVRVGSFFKPRNFGAMILTALLVGVVTAVGLALLVVPGIIIGFLAQFAVAFVVDRSLSPVAGLKASISTAKNNVGGALLSWLVQYAVLLVGTVICAVGLLVAGPLATLIQTYTYRRLSGGQVAPLS